MTEQTLPWYVLRPTIRGDRRAAEELKEAKVEHFMPTYKRYSVIRHTKAQVKTTEMLLMPGYIFARLDQTQLASVPGKLKHVAAVYVPPGSDYALPAEPKAVAQLQRMCAKGKFDQGKRNGEGFNRGDRVLIVDGGLFDGWLATFKDGRAKAGFVRVVLDQMFGSPRAITVEEQFIRTY